MPCLVHDGEVVVGEGGKDGRGRHVEQEPIMAAQRKVRSSVLENTMTPSNCPEQTILNHYISFLFLTHYDDPQYKTERDNSEQQGCGCEQELGNTGCVVPSKLSLSAQTFCKMNNYLCSTLLCFITLTEFWRP